MTPEIPIESFEIFAMGLDHPECLAFDKAGFLWAGGEAGQVYRIDTAGKVTTIATMGGFCAGLAFSPEDELFVCNASHGIVKIRPSGEYSVFASHAGNHKMICPNYALFDSAGNYYVTDSGNWKKNNGYLLRFTPDGQGRILGGPFGYANGLALSTDEKTLFMVESNTDRVFRFEIKPDGAISPPEIYAEQAGRFPDGLTLDVDGNLYVSCYASDDIHRVSPDGKKTLFAYDRNAILLGSPTNMAFGGENLDVMYVANLARTTITRARVNRRGQPLANQKKGMYGAA